MKFVRMSVHKLSLYLEGKREVGGVTQLSFALCLSPHVETGGAVCTATPNKFGHCSLCHFDRFLMNSYYYKKIFVVTGVLVVTDG